MIHTAATLLLLPSTPELWCNNQRKHSLRGFTIHLDAFFSLSLSLYFFCSRPLGVTAACHSIPAQTAGPGCCVAKKIYSPHPLSHVKLMAHLRLSIKMSGDKEGEMQQEERDWDVLLYSPLYPHIQRLISKQYVSL